MQIDYGQLIVEGEPELIALERRLRGSPLQPRVQMLRLLKSGRVQSLRACAPMLGFSLRHLNRWWSLYRHDGLDGLMTPTIRRGRRSQLTAEASAALREEIAAGRIQHLDHARRYLSEQWNIQYQSLNGIWWMLRRDGISIGGARRPPRNGK
jgi:transposase